MNKVIKKKLALALALVMIVGLVPMYASAAVTSDQLAAYNTSITESLDVLAAIRTRLQTIGASSNAESQGLIAASRVLAQQIINNVPPANLTSAIANSMWLDELQAITATAISANANTLPEVTQSFTLQTAPNMPAGAVQNTAALNSAQLAAANSAQVTVAANGPTSDALSLANQNVLFSKTDLSGDLGNAETLVANLEAAGLTTQATAVQAAIDAAQAVYDNPAATWTQVANAVNSLGTAVTDVLGTATAPTDPAGLAAMVNALVALGNANPGNEILQNRITSVINALETADLVNSTGITRLRLGLPITAANVVNGTHGANLQDLADTAALINGILNQYGGGTQPPVEPKEIQVHRLYNAGLSAHLLSSDAGEMADLIANYGWVDQGIAFDAWSKDAHPADAVPVNRFFTPDGRHMYTANAGERAQWIAWGWQNDGVLFYQPTAAEGGEPVTRLFNSGLDRHLWTMDATEIANLVANWGWANEGTAFLAFPAE